MKKHNLDQESRKAVVHEGIPMNQTQAVFGAKVESSAGTETFLCIADSPKVGYLSLHFRVIHRLDERASVTPPDHTSPLSFLEELRCIGRSDILFSSKVQPDVVELLRVTLQTEYGKDAKIEVKAINPPDLYQVLFQP
jgi:hypothetical protein